MKRSPILVFLALITLCSLQSHGAALTPHAPLIIPNLDDIEAISDGIKIVGAILTHSAHALSQHEEWLEHMVTLATAYAVSRLAWQVGTSTLLPKLMRRVQHVSGVVPTTKALRRFHTDYPTLSLCLRSGFGIYAAYATAPYAVRLARFDLVRCGLAPLGVSWDLIGIDMTLSGVSVVTTRQDMHRAIDHDHSEMEELLADPTVSEASINFPACLKDMHPCLNRHPKNSGFSALLDSPYITPDARDEEGNTILHHVAQSLGNPVLAMVLAHPRFADIDVNAQNNAGETVLHRAALGNIASLQAILADGRFTAITTKDRKGNTALHYAVTYSHRPENIRALLAERRFVALDAVNNEGLTALQSVVLSHRNPMYAQELIGFRLTHPLGAADDLVHESQLPGIRTVDPNSRCTMRVTLA